MKTSRPTKNRLRIGLVAPHIFMHRDILPQVIFSPGQLAIDLADGLQKLGADVTLFSPGPVATRARNITADLSLFEQEIAGRGDTYLDLLKKHPFTFVTLARQVQAEMIAKAYAMANAGELDVVHIYTNEEDTALPFAELCNKPVVFTHHDPFNFLVKYKNVFPKYKHLNWVSMSLAQRAGMPKDTNWVANIYHGIAAGRFEPLASPTGDYIAYLGRIIQPKGLHLAIAAAKKAGLPLKIAGKHYTGHKDTYWQECIVPELGGAIEYVGFIKNDADKQAFLGNAAAVVVSSLFDEPFGMVSIEALACGTPVIGLDSGATPEIITHGENGLIVKKTDKAAIVANLALAMRDASSLSRTAARASFEARFTLERMCSEHLALYSSQNIAKSAITS
jgi:glycosyltransferase involved in cell wall biosynthesis